MTSVKSQTGAKAEQDKRLAEILETASTKKKSGQSSLAAGKPDQALVDFRAALSIEVQELGEKHTIPASTKLHIGGVLYSKGQNEEAWKTYDEALPILKNQMQRSNKALAASSLSQANIHFSRGDYANAIAHFQNALTHQKIAYGDEHIEVTLALMPSPGARPTPSPHLSPPPPPLPPPAQTVGALDGLALAHHALKQNPEALSYHSASLGVKLRTHGEDSVAVASTYCNMAAIYDRLGRREDALRTLDLVVAIYDRRETCMHACMHACMHTYIHTY
jgi:tetratricopeptide (TPR) repeat protein